MSDVIIVGGGVAGLSAALHCAELGLKTVLIEAGTYPSHKMCGEFFSPEALPLLAQLKIQPAIMLRNMRMIVNERVAEFPLPMPAGSMSRFYFDYELMQRAASAGATIYTTTTVSNINVVNGGYELIISTGEVLRTKKLIIGAGRVTQLLQKRVKPLPVRYVGIKAHFRGVTIPHELLQMYMFAGGYAGVSMIDDTTINIACLMEQKYVSSYNSGPDFLMHNAEKSHHDLLVSILKAHQLFDWMSVAIPEFGMRDLPVMPNLFYIGDAAGSVPPATGDGLALALLSGKMVAPFVMAGDSRGFMHAWQHEHKRIFYVGSILNYIMLSPLLSRLSSAMISHIPSIVKPIFNITRKLSK